MRSNKEKPMRQSDQERCAGGLALIRAAKAIASREEVKFFDVIATFEVDEAAWRCTGYATFAELLEREDICVASRYDKYKKAVEQFGHAAVIANGVRQMARLLVVPEDAPSRSNPDRTARAVILGKLDDARTKRSTVTSEWNVRRIVENEYDKPAAPARGIPASVREIAAKNEALAKVKTKVLSQAEQLKAAKATIASLKTENTALKKEVARLLRLTSDQAAE